MSKSREFKLAILVSIDEEDDLYRIRLDDVCQNETDSSWQLSTHYTSKTYPKNTLEDLSFEGREIEDFGYAIIARLYAFVTTNKNKQLKIENITNPIATRILKMGDEDIIIIIGKPDIFADNVYCPYSIEYCKEKKFSYASGLDSVQALQFAIRKINAYLSFMSESKKITIQRLDENIFTTSFDD